MNKTIKILEQLLEANPESWETRQHLAELLLNEGDPNKALSVFESGPSIPEDEESQLFYAQLTSHLDLNKALQIYNDILKKNKACALAYLGISKVYKKRGLLKEAQKYFGVATVIDESLSKLESSDELTEDENSTTETPDIKEIPNVKDLEQQISNPFPSKEGLDSIELPTDHIAEDDDDTEDLDTHFANQGLIKTDFSQVGGMEEIKERIRMNILYPFKNPEVFKKFNKRAGGGLMFYGPPGCGKTLIARATAGETGARFFSIGITDVLSKWVGESERRLHELFRHARAKAPAVMFFDEIDALGMSRTNARGAAIATTINQFLVEMDGSTNPNENIMILAATNAPWHVDSAFRRPGRFDKTMLIPPPDAEAREEILNIYLKDIPLGKIDIKKLIKLTKDFSGADIKSAIDTASEAAIYEEMKSGKDAVVTQKMLINAIKSTSPSSMEWLDTARNYADYSNRSGQYDELVRYFEEHE